MNVVSVVRKILIVGSVSLGIDLLGFGRGWCVVDFGVVWFILMVDIVVIVYFV